MIGVPFAGESAERSSENAGDRGRERPLGRFRLDGLAEAIDADEPGSDRALGAPDQASDLALR